MSNLIKHRRVSTAAFELVYHQMILEPNTSFTLLQDSVGFCAVQFDAPPIEIYCTADSRDYRILMSQSNPLNE